MQMWMRCAETRLPNCQHSLYQPIDLFALKLPPFSTRQFCSGTQMQRWNRHECEHGCIHGVRGTPWTMGEGVLKKHMCLLLWCGLGWRACFTQTNHLPKRTYWKYWKRMFRQRPRAVLAGLYLPDAEHCREGTWGVWCMYAHTYANKMK